MKIINRSGVVIVVACVVISVLSVNANAFNLSGRQWEDGRTTFLVSLFGTPTNFAPGSDFDQAFQDAIANWNETSTFRFDSNTQAADPCLSNTGNSIGFTDDLCDSEFGESTLAVARSNFIGNSLTRVTIFFNKAFEWDVYSGPRVGQTGTDFRRVAIHELGHALGLDHSDTNSAIMYPIIGDVDLAAADDLAGAAAIYDTDNDNVGQAFDNCPNVANAEQGNLDSDSFGDACDSDVDGDGIGQSDNCPLISNPDQTDSDNNGVGDACDSGLNNPLPEPQPDLEPIGLSVDQSFGLTNLSTEVFEFGAGSTNGIFSQTFTVNTTGELASVVLPVSCQSGDLQVSIRDLDDGNPSSTTIFQSTTLATNLQASLVTAHLPSQSYNAGDRLAIVLDSSGVCAWTLAESGDYSGGGGFFSRDGVAWTELDFDWPFETNVGQNLALSGEASQSTTAFEGSASRAIDGDINGDFNQGSVSQTNSSLNPWWQVSLNNTNRIGDIVIYNREDCCADQLRNFSVLVRNSDDEIVFIEDIDTPVSFPLIVNANGIQGDTVVVQVNDTNSLSLAEVQVFASVANPIVTMQKANNLDFAIDGDNGGADGQNVYLWNYDPSNINQRWEEIDQGNGFYSYRKLNTAFCMEGRDGTNGGEPEVMLQTCSNVDVNQQWEKVQVSGDIYNLELRNSTFSIDGNNGAQRRQSVYMFGTNNANANQQWLFSTQGVVD